MTCFNKDVCKRQRWKKFIIINAIDYTVRYSTSTVVTFFFFFSLNYGIFFILSFLKKLEKGGIGTTVVMITLVSHIFCSRPKYYVISTVPGTNIIIRTVRYEYWLIGRMGSLTYVVYFVVVPVHYRTVPYCTVPVACQ